MSFAAKAARKQFLADSYMIYPESYGFVQNRSTSESRQYKL